MVPILLFGISDKAGLFAACKAAQTTQNINILHEAILDIIISFKRIINALIRYVDAQADICLLSVPTTRSGYLVTMPNYVFLW